MTDGSDNLITLARGVTLHPDDLRIQYSRSSGPGGQNVNKVSTKAEIWVRPAALRGLSERALARFLQMAANRITAEGEVHIAADVERTQEGNREAVLDRLRVLVEQALHEPKIRKKTKPSKASKRRRVDGKKRRGAIKAGRRSSGDD